MCVCDSVSKNIMDTFLILFLGKRATVCLKLISSMSLMYALPLDSMTVDNTSSLATFVTISKTLNAHYKGKEVNHCGNRYHKSVESRACLVYMLI